MNKPTTRLDSPFRINLEQQKKRAKELLKALRTQQSLALSRLQNFHPRYSNIHLLHPETLKLSDAQLVIARELGLPSWTKLKHHIAAMNQASEAIEKKQTAPDAKYPTLHIRCGSDLQKVLPQAGFVGDFLEYTEVYGQGQISHNENFQKIRDDFLYQAYGVFTEMTMQQMQQRASLSQNTLNQAAQKYQRIVLWFEHDSFDQLILARLLDFFASTKVPDRLEMVNINHFPGSARFIGLGQLPAEAIRLLWEQRTSINTQQLSLAGKVWHILGNTSPAEIYTLIQSKEISHLQNMRGALMRHLQELPSVENGLSLTEHLTLEILADKPCTAGTLFQQLTRQLDPLPWLGDIMYWYILESMMTASDDVFTISTADLIKPWHQRTLNITKTGVDCLRGKIDWLSLKPKIRWLGGVKISAFHSCWRWDKHSEHIVLIPPSV